jgi:3-hydroxyisobutyrate dehydrogenase
MSDAKPNVAVIGLGSMGMGMACSLLREGFAVAGCDTNPAARGAFVAAGGTSFETPAEAAAGAAIVVSVVVNAAQTEQILFGPGGVADAMDAGGLFVSCVTMDPALARTFAARIEATGHLYLDAPISGGSVRAAEGTLTIMASGTAEAFSAGEAALDAVAAKVFRLGDTAGQGSAFKMVNQLLAGVHIAVASEAMVFAAAQGLDLAQVYEVITASAGNSWMFENRMPHVLAGDYSPASAIDIFVKDLGIVDDMARAARMPTPIAAAALHMYLAASGMGMGREDDSSVARVYATMSNQTLPGAQNR